MGQRKGAASTDAPHPGPRHLFEEENRRAQELLDNTAQRHEQLQEKCKQLQQKKQRWSRSPSPSP